MQCPVVLSIYLWQDELGALVVLDLSTKVVREKYQKLSCNSIIGSWMIS